MKKSEYLSIRIDTETKAKLEKIAKEKEWTISHLVSKLIKDSINTNNN